MALINGKATNSRGDLVQIPDCEFIIPGINVQLSGGPGRIIFNNLPDISDSKGASYNDETVPGRSYPIKTFSHGENRSFTLNFNLYTLKRGDEDLNLRTIRALQSCVYPRDGNGSLPYLPPTICRFKCGKILSKNFLCVVVTNYSLKFPTDVAWDQNSYLPYRVEVSLNLDVVFPSIELPGQEKIVRDF
jgi:hypothetical protein